MIITTVISSLSKKDIECFLHFCIDNGLIRSWFFNGEYHVRGNNGNELVIRLA